jgi:alkylation response protein AidB-like acyl-CoA dehydrogenase
MNKRLNIDGLISRTYKLQDINDGLQAHDGRRGRARRGGVRLNTDDFGLTEEQLLIRRNVAELLARVLPAEEIVGSTPIRSSRGRRSMRSPRPATWRWPYEPAYGGAGGSRKDLVILVEALARHYSGASSLYLPTVVYGGMHLQLTAGEHLRRRYLPEICAGKLKAAFALSEPDTGSDASGIKTRAVRDGNGYRLSGQKLYISAAHVADYLVVGPRPTARRGTRATLFWVDAHAPGVSMKPLETLGRRTTHPNEIFFDGVFVPGDHVIGEENRGWSGLMKGLNLERSALPHRPAATCISRSSTPRPSRSSAGQFGQPISKFQAIQHKFADMRIMLKTTQALTWRLADMLDAGLDPVEETAIAKIQGTDGEFKLRPPRHGDHGRRGLHHGARHPALFRDVRVGSIGGGTNDIQRNTIAKMMGCRPLVKMSEGPGETGELTLVLPGALGGEKGGLGAADRPPFSTVFSAFFPFLAHPVRKR